MRFFFISIFLSFSLIYSQDKITYRESYTLSHLPVSYSGPESRSYLAQLVHNLLGDQLSLQTTVYLETPEILEILYSTPDERGEDPGKSISHPKEGKYYSLSTISESGGDFSLKTAILAEEGENVSLSASLMRGKKQIFFWKLNGKEEDITQMTKEISTLLRNVLSGETGVLTVSSTPPASLYLDEIYQGETPLTIRELPAKNYQLSLRTKNYEIYRESISLDKDEDKKINLALTPLSGELNLSVASNPSGASVFLGNYYAGVTPLSLSSLRPGMVLLRLEKDGYQSNLQELTLEKESTSAFVELSPLQETNSKPFFTWKRTHQITLVAAALSAGATITSLVLMDSATEQRLLAQERGESGNSYARKEEQYEIMAYSFAGTTLLFAGISTWALYRHVKHWENLNYNAYSGYRELSYSYHF